MEKKNECTLFLFYIYMNTFMFFIHKFNYLEETRQIFGKEEITVFDYLFPALSVSNS